MKSVKIPKESNSDFAWRMKSEGKLLSVDEVYRFLDLVAKIGNRTDALAILVGERHE